MKIEIYDTTLRDGAQREGISFSLADKLKIVQKLDELGFDYIEGGWPSSNPKDFEFFKDVRNLNLRSAVVSAFSMTCRKGMEPEKDPNLKQLLEAKTKAVTFFGKSWDLQVKKVMRTSLKENLSLIKKSCALFVLKGRRVFYDAEHFFDGFKANQHYTLSTLKAAVEGGAERIILCDTNGGTLPWEINQILTKVRKIIRIPLGIHAHNDGGLATANTLTAINSGVIQVQGTINGYGERCGNADLCVVIPNLQLKMGFDCLPKNKLPKLTEISRYVAEIANLNPDPFQPYVGSSVFTHKGGVHADGMAKCKTSYQHIDPNLVGNFSRVIVSELSGKANILAKSAEFGLDLEQPPKLVRQILNQVKELENQGFQFESADGSLELLFHRNLNKSEPPFNLLNFKIFVENYKSNFISKARVKLEVKGKIIQSTEKGNGPVNALDKALRKALLPFYPGLKNVYLTDYKVRILNEKAGAAAQVRVLIDSSDGKNKWITIGSSTNIIEASWQALSDSLEYPIYKNLI